MICKRKEITMSDKLFVDRYDVASGAFQTAGDASASIKRKLKQLGVDAVTLRRVAVASYEAELNLIIHSDGGNLIMEMSPDEVMLISKDIGPGIPDIGKALEEGYSTASEEARDLGFGAGMGLPNMKRNADSFDIVSEVGAGTTIRMGFAIKR